MFYATDFKSGWRTAALRPLRFSVTALFYLCDPRQTRLKGKYVLFFGNVASIIGYGPQQFL